LKSNAYRLYQLFKYAIYALLAFNIAWFFSIEWPAASGYRFGSGLGIADIIDAFAATIDTTAWVVLLLMFELETCVLDERHFTPRVIVSLHVLRAACYGFIVYSFFGYVVRLTFLQSATPLTDVTTVCGLVAEQWSYMATLDRFLEITAGNCTELGQSGALFRIDGLKTAIDQADLTEAVRLAWVDVINAGVWLGIVMILEVDVRLQERNRLQGTVLKVSTALKVLFYSTLFCAAVYWGIKGTFVEFWDAFLWLVAFFFIEMNVIEWRHEDSEKLSADHTGSGIPAT